MQAASRPMTTFAAAPAGTYTVRVGGAAASNGGTVTVDYMG